MGEVKLLPDRQHHINRSPA